jgi:hypothetical protein
MSDKTHGQRQEETVSEDKTYEMARIEHLTGTRDHGKDANIAQYEGREENS